MAVPDPDVLYRKLTSGEASSISAVGDALSDARSSLTEAADRLSAGISGATSNWRGEAAQEFLGRGKRSARALAEAHRRLHTAERVVRRAASAYRTLAASADAAIRPWRAMGGTAMAKEPQLALAVIRKLISARSTYEATLNAHADALTSATDSDRSDLTHVGEHSPWIPQGLAYLGGKRDQFLVASYHDGSTNDDGSLLQTDDKINPAAQSRLAVVNNADGAEEKYVDLGGKQYQGPLGQYGEGDPPNHVGGVAAHGDHVWVTSTVGEPPDQKSEIYRYSQRDIDRAKAGETIHPQQVFEAPASSYVTYADGRLWIGQYRTDSYQDDNPDAPEPKLYGYTVDDDGVIVDDDTAPPEVYTTPRHVQGAVVRDDELIFSKSGDDPGLYTYDRDVDLDPDSPRDYHEDQNKVEEIEEVDGEIVTAHEGGADEYLSFWDRILGDDDQDLTRTPLEDLGLDADGGDGYAADPDSLQKAAGVVDQAGGILHGTAGRVSGLQLVAHVLGEVPAAETFAATVTRFIADSGTAIQSGSETAGDIADSLITNAESYRRQEDWFTSGLRGLGFG